MPQIPTYGETQSGISDLDRSLESLCKSFEHFTNHAEATNKRIDEILDILKSKDDRDKTADAQLNAIEYHSKKNNIVIIGLDISGDAATTKPTKRSTTSTPVEETQPVSKSATMKANFVKFARQTLSVTLEPYDITSIHLLPPWRNGKHPILVQFLSAEKKAEVMSRRLQLKGTDIYINEHLSRHNRELFRQARQLKREKKIVSAWSEHCCVYVKIHEGGRRVKVRSLADIAKLC